MWSDLNLYIFEKVISHLDTFEIVFVIPHVCYKWKSALKHCILPKTVNLSADHMSQIECKLTDEHLHKLLINFNFSNTLSLDLSNQYTLRDRSILNISNYCINLRSINLSGCCSVSDVSFKYLSNVATLSSISISLSEVTGSSLHYLAQLRNLECIVLEKLFRLRLDYLQDFLAGSPALKTIVIRQCKLITNDLFLFILSPSVELPLLEELVLDGLMENKNNAGQLISMIEEQTFVRFLSLKTINFFNLTWLLDLHLMYLLKFCNISRLVSFSIVRCNPSLSSSITTLLSAPNVKDFFIEGNQSIQDRDLLLVMFNNKQGLFKNCNNISDQMKRQMHRTNPNIRFEDGTISLRLHHTK